MLLSGDETLAEARLLHPLQEGYFVLAQKTREDCAGKKGWREKAYRMGLLEEAVSAVKLDPSNRYISQASFVGARRGVAHVHALRSAFIDLDCQEKLGIAPNEHFIETVLLRAAQVGIPEPTMIVCSGRGLYAKWIFQDSITAAQLDKWKFLNDALLDLFHQFGADMKVRDAARVLRLIGTSNPKANADGQIVRLARENVNLHDFDQLCSQVAAATLLHGISTASTDRMQRVRREKTIARATLLTEAAPTDLRGLMDFEAIRRPILVDEAGRGGNGRLSRSGKEGLSWRRFVDLRNLIISRGGAPKGSRDQFVFWMLNHLSLSGMVTPANFEQEAVDLIRLFPRHDGFDPLNDGSLSTLAKKLCSAASGEMVEYRGRKYSPLYTPSNDYLLNAFEISPEEEQRMTTIISGAEKTRRADLKAPGRAERRDVREKRPEVIRALVENEKTEICDIANELGISERQARRVVSKTLKPATRSQTIAGKIGLAQELHSTGMSNSEIAVEMGVSARHVRRWLTRPQKSSISQAMTTPTPSVNVAIAQNTPATTRAFEAVAPKDHKASGPPQFMRTSRTFFSVSMEGEEEGPKGLHPSQKITIDVAQTCFGPPQLSQNSQTNTHWHDQTPTWQAPHPQKGRPIFGTRQRSKRPLTTPTMPPARASHEHKRSSQANTTSQAVSTEDQTPYGSVQAWMANVESRFSKQRQQEVDAAALANQKRQEINSRETSALVEIARSKARAALSKDAGSRAIAAAQPSPIFQSDYPISTEPKMQNANSTSTPASGRAAELLARARLVASQKAKGVRSPIQREAITHPRQNASSQLPASEQDTSTTATPAEDPFGESLFEGYGSEPPEGPPPPFLDAFDLAALEDIQVVDTHPPIAQPYKSNTLTRRPTFGRQQLSRLPGGIAPSPAPQRSVGKCENFRDLPNAPSTTKPQDSRSPASERGLVKAERSNDPLWDDATRPAGTAYTAQEWEQARENGRYHVIEILSGKERGLLQIPAKRIDTSVVKRKVVANGKVVDASEADQPTKSPMQVMGQMIGQAFDGCMLVGPTAKPSHPSHVRARAIKVTDPSPLKLDFYYGVIEPLEMSNSWARGSTLTLEGHTFLGPVKDVRPEDGEAESLRERQRGG